MKKVFSAALLLFLVALGANNVQAQQGFEAKHSFLSGGIAFVPGVGGYAQYGYGINEHFELGITFAIVGQQYSYYGYTASTGASAFGARAAYHFNTENKFDPYLTAGLGLISTTTSYGSYSVSSSALGFMGGVGTRYYFTDKLAANAEVVYGEPWVKLGLSYKL